MNTKAILLLTLGHLVTDTSQGGVPLLLPYLKESLHLSYAATGAIILVLNITSSVIQPLFGYLTDRWRLKWLMPAGLAISGLGFAVIGYSGSYAMVLAAVSLTGLGVASYHPEAFKTVTNFAGTRKVIAMSWFMVGGNLGIALGPIMTTAYLAWLGLGGTVLHVVPGAIAAVLFLLAWPWWNQAQGSAAKAGGASARPVPVGGRIAALSILMLSVALRSWIHSGIITYVPFYYVRVLGGDPIMAGNLISTFLVTGVVGTIIGAPLAERFGHKAFYVGTVLLASPLLFMFLNVGGVLLFVVLGLVGACLVSTWSVVVVMAQSIMPNRPGMVSGLMVGLALGAGGVGATVLGALADRFGVTTVLFVTAFMPLLSALAGIFIPYPLKEEPATAA